MSTTSIMTVGIDVTYSIPLGPSGSRTKLPLPQEPTAPANLQGALKKKTDFTVYIEYDLHIYTDICTQIHEISTRSDC